ncbi:MAG: SDR family oxidoreductase [Solirubrobacteraceae bacterium]|nr:SDR family oxidoreductase [Patulibacter sp.]
MPAETGAILLTGATGFLGGEVLRRIIDGTDRDVVTITRRSLGIDHPRVRQLRADFSEGPLPPLPSDIDTVVHCAASVAFDLPIEEQRAINVVGTQRVMDAAAALPGLRRFMHVSTAFVAGSHEGPFGPEDLDRGQTFRNTYEQSKFEAEQHVAASGLPTQVVRPSIVVGDQHTGWTTSFNVIYGPLRAYAKGLMNVAPGQVDAPVDLVPIDVVADGMALLLGEPVGGTHLLVSGPKAPTVGEFVELAAARFDRPPAFVVDPAVLVEVIDALPADEAMKARRALEQAGTLLPYFDVRCAFDDPATAALLAGSGITVPYLRDYLGVLVDFAETARWGKRKPEPAPLTRQEAGA